MSPYARLLGELVCPGCRRGFSEPSALTTNAALELECRRCGAIYPALGRTHSVLRDPTQSRSDPQADALLFEQYLPSQFPDLAASKRLARRLSVNRRLMNWIDTALAANAPQKGPAIELGCGPGAYGEIWRRHAAFTILADIRPVFVQYAAEHWASDKRIAVLHCDAHDPPFRAASMALAAAINVVDSTTEPWLLLGQMDALLKPGGLAVITLPYAANLNGPEDLFATLTGRRPEIPHLSYEILASKDWIAWAVPSAARLVMEYQVHAVLARKNA